MRANLLWVVKVFVISVLGSLAAFLLADLFSLFMGVEVEWEALGTAFYKALKLGGILTIATIVMVLVNSVRNKGDS